MFKWMYSDCLLLLFFFLSPVPGGFFAIVAEIKYEFIEIQNDKNTSIYCILSLSCHLPSLIPKLMFRTHSIKYRCMCVIDSSNCQKLAQCPMSERKTHRCCCCCCCWLDINSMITKGYLICNFSLSPLKCALLCVCSTQIN